MKKNIIVIIAVYLCIIKCGTKEHYIIPKKTKVDSLALFYLDSLNEYNFITRISAKDSVEKIISSINSGKQEQIKINCVYNLKVFTSDSTYLILLNKNYCKYVGIAYKLNIDLISYILKKQTNAQAKVTTQ